MTDPSSLADTTVRKRDGLVEPFAPAKLVACLRRTLQEAQDPDPPATAEGIADAVGQYLLQSDATPPWPTPQIRELVEAVLSQSGHQLAAQVLRASARRRDHLRKLLHVANFRPRQGRYVNRRWSKSTVVATLQTQHGLQRPTARWIAGQVEGAILRSGKRLVTTGLIREMIASELLEWGLDPTVLTVKQREQAAPPEPAGNRGDARPGAKDAPS